MRFASAYAVLLVATSSRRKIFSNVAERSRSSSRTTNGSARSDRTATTFSPSAWCGAAALLSMVDRRVIALFGRDNVESRTMSRLPRIGITLLLVSLPLAAQTFNEAPVSDVSGYGYVSETVYAAGTNGDGFLAVGGRRGYLFAHRITADGDTLDRAGIPLALPPPSPALGGFSAGDTRTSLTPSRRAAARTATD